MMQQQTTCYITLKDGIIITIKCDRMFIKDNGVLTLETFNEKDGIYEYFPKGEWLHIRVEEIYPEEELL